MKFLLCSLFIIGYLTTNHVPVLTTSFSIHLTGYLWSDETIEVKEQICYHEILDRPIFKDDTKRHIFDPNYCFYSAQMIIFQSLTGREISLNHASLEELMTLKGIGIKTAQKIIDYRRDTPFLLIEEIMNISGIKEKKFDYIKDDLVI